MVLDRAADTNGYADNTLVELLQALLCRAINPRKVGQHARAHAESVRCSSWPNTLTHHGFRIFWESCNNARSLFGGTHHGHFFVSVRVPHIAARTLTLTFGRRYRLVGCCRRGRHMNVRVVMAVAVIMDLAGATLEQYDQITKKLGLTHGGQAAPGELFHWAALTDDGLRVVEVWDSQEQFDAWAQQRIGPASAEVGIPAPPQVTVYELHNYLTAGSA